VAGQPGIDATTPWPAAVGLLRRAPDRAAVLLDYDGTLAPIVDDPAAARPLPESLDALRTLVPAYRLVAVVSGRPASFLAAHLAVPGLVRIGAYGLEQVTDAGVVELPAVTSWRAAVAGVARRALAAAPPGVVVEDKGVGVTLHYRTAPAAAAWAYAFADAEARATGLLRHYARYSVELRPPLAVDKGTTVSALLAEAGVSAGCVCGDDTGDVPAFTAVATLPVALRVAVRSAETPPELTAAANLAVDGPAGVLALLRALAP
jgi:trehalose 6-phosphate phosphatase